MVTASAQRVPVGLQVVGCRRDRGNRAAHGLRIGDVLQPVGEEACNLHVEGRVRTNTCASPVHPRRSSRWDSPWARRQIAALAPEDVSLQLIDEWIGAGELTGQRQIGMQDHPHGVFDLDVRAMDFDLEITETMEREARLKNFAGGLSAQRVVIRRPAVRRLAKWSRPSASIISACRSVTVAPLGPFRRRRTRPTMFWPKS